MILNGLIMSSRLPYMMEKTHSWLSILNCGKTDMSMVRIQKLILWVTMTNIMKLIPSKICGLQNAR